MKSQILRNAPPASTRRRKRGTARLFVLTAACAATGAVAAPAAAPATPAAARLAGAQADAAPQRMNIAAGPLGDAIKRLEDLTTMKIVVTTAGIEGIQSPGASGMLTPRQALEQMLAGTNVSFTLTPDGATLGIQGLSEFVSVASPARLASPKYVAPLRDTPQTVVVIPQQILQQQNAVSLRDALRNTPGITMNVGEGPSGWANGDEVLIRGFNAQSDIYIDGARDPGVVSRDMYNVESVAVAKGPTSVVGGRGSTGGSINLATKTPSLTDASRMQFTGGSADYGRATIDVNRRVSKTVALRMNGLWQDAGYAGRDVQRNKTWAVAPSLAVGLGKPTRATFSYSHMEQDNIVDLGLPTLLPDVAINQGITVNDLNFNNFYGITSRDHEKTTSQIATATVEHQFNARHTLRNLTRYGKNYRNAIITPPRPVTTVAGQGSADPGYDPTVAQIRRTDTKYQNRNDQLTTNQTDLLTSFRTGHLVHNADIGIEVLRDHQPTYAVVDRFTNGRPPVADLFNPGSGDVPYRPALERSGAASDALLTSSAYYVFDTVKFSERWQADLGIRYDRVKIDFDSTAVSGVVTNFGRVDKAVTGRAGIVFKPVQEGSVYGVFSTSFTPSYDGAHGLTVAAPGTTGTSGAFSIALPPEQAENMEGGVKWDLPHGGQVTAAVFRTVKTNARTVDSSGVTRMLGNQRVQGVEFGVNGNLTPRWGAFAGLALMDGKVVQSLSTLDVGQRLGYVPKVSMNVWTTYRLPMNLTLGGGVNYSDGHYFNNTGGFDYVSNAFNPKYVANAAAIQALTKYTIVNAMVIYPVNRHIELQLNVTNLGNTRYSDRAYDRHMLPGPTRQILFSPVITW